MPFARCVHCLKTRLRTKDHAPPRSWYPPELAVQCPTAPSCRECNKILSGIETHLRDRVGLCLAPYHGPSAAHAREKAIRAISPSAATTDEERRIRGANLRRIFKYATPASARIGEVLVPFGPMTDDHLGIPMSALAFPRVGEKMVRVLTYWRFRRYIEPPLTVHADVIRIEGWADFDAMTRAPGVERIEHAPDLVSWIVPTDPMSPRQWWAFLYWGTVRQLAVVGTPAQLAEIPALATEGDDGGASG